MMRPPWGERGARGRTGRRANRCGGARGRGMVITPLEIENHEFQRKMRGCDPDEVKAFLGLIAEEFEKLVVSNGKLQEEIAELRERLGELRERERILKETMLTAQRL